MSKDGRTMSGMQRTTEKRHRSKTMRWLVFAAPFLGSVLLLPASSHAQSLSQLLGSGNGNDISAAK